MVYRLSKGDKEIFRLSQQNPNYFLDYYLRGSNTGTWWIPGATTERWEVGYKKLYTEWKQLKKPEQFQLNDNVYTVMWEHEKARDFPDKPAFHHHHGMLMLPYHVDLFYDRTPIRTIIGGFGSGKTMGAVQSLLIWAATLSMFRGFALAPLSIQATEVYRIAMDMIAGTLYEKRFVISSRERPFPKLTIGNDLVGESTIECYPIAGAEDKLRTLTGDCAIIDQAESNAIYLPEVIRSVGTRFRGRVSRNGRERLGTITLIANSGDNQHLWDIYDEAEHDPANYKSLSPSSYDNPWLTDKDLARFEKQVGNSEESRQMYMFGKRPLGNGDHFSREILERMRDTKLDNIMESGLLEQEKTGVNKGYIKLEARGVGVYEWRLPYEEGRTYLVISDPGTKNPPYRDSPPILVFDITDFPGTRENVNPALLVGFIWVFGNNNIQSWATRYAEIVRYYHAIGTNGFDATGYQSGYDQWLHILEGLLPEKINLGGNNKSMCLNSAKMLTANSMVKAPAGINQLYAQLARYEYPPEPNRLRQDIVMAFIMACWWMQRLYYFDDSEFEPINNIVPFDRYQQRQINRYGRHTR